jgi:hypothetical protein
LFSPKFKIMKFLLLISAFTLSFVSFSQTEVSNFENSETSSISKKMEVLISPNPAIDKCTVIGEEGASCTIYSSTGTYIGTWNFENSNTVLLTDLPTGILQAVIEKMDLWW